MLMLPRGEIMQKALAPDPVITTCISCGESCGNKDEICDGCSNSMIEIRQADVKHDGPTPYFED